MRVKQLRRILTAVICLLPLGLMPGLAGAAPEAGPELFDYIVQLEVGEDPKFWAPYLLEEVGVPENERDYDGAQGTRIPETYTEIFDSEAGEAFGLWLKLTAPELAKMAAIVGRAPGLQGVEAGEVSLPDPIDVSGPISGAGMNGAQVTPTGFTRVGALTSVFERGGLTNKAEQNGLQVGILDTGLDVRHSDLNVAGGYNCTHDSRGKDGWGVDVHGHGTHVGGTVGAKDNNYLTLGILPGVPLVGISVLSFDGSGSWAGVACGIDVALRLGLPIVNLSLGGSSFASLPGTWDVMHNGFANAAAQGLIIVVAAGNDGIDAINQVPASYEGVVPVSAIVDFDGLPGGSGVGLPGCGLGHPDDAAASFTNYGPSVVFAAPGGCILSTIPGNQMGYASGTSMASPHVTGVLAAYMALCPEDKDPLKTVLRYSSDPEWTEGAGFWDFDRDPFKEPLVRYGAPCEEDS
jgi:subtilisin family serine protease